MNAITPGRRAAMSLRVPSLVAALVLATTTMAHAQDSGTDAEKAAVRKALDHYLQGHATGSGAEFAMAFDTVANLYFMRGDTLRVWPSREYIAAAPGKPAADEAKRKRRIDFIDVTGTAAVAKITLEYPIVTFTDYMSLLKVGDEWKIVAKMFDARR